MQHTATTNSQIIYGRKQRPARPWIFLIPVLACIAWSSMPAIKALGAAFALKWDDSSLSMDKPLETRRRIQKRFLKQDVYIPLEDITLADGNGAADGDYLFVMRKNCGQGRIFVWVPLRFRLPLTGEKVREWCLNL